MNTYNVITIDDIADFETCKITADSVSIVDGNLVFRRGSDVIRIIARGRWMDCMLMGKEKDE